MMTRGCLSFCLLALAQIITGFAGEVPTVSATGSWFTEHVDADKGMVHQVLTHRLPDGRFVSHFRGRRHDLPDRLLDYAISGKWEIVGSREIVHFENFVIYEPEVTPRGGPLDAKDEYEILEQGAERFVTRSEAGVTFTAHRVPADFKLPDLPTPPQAKQPREQDKTRFDAYLRL